MRLGTSRRSPQHHHHRCHPLRHRRRRLCRCHLRHRRHRPPPRIQRRPSPPIARPAPSRPSRQMPWLLDPPLPRPPTFQLKLQLCLWCSPYPFERLHLPALSHMLDRLLCAQTLLRASSRTRFDALAGLARGRPAGRGRGRRSLTCLRACCCCVRSYVCLTEP